MAYQFSRKHRTVWWPATARIPMDGGDVDERDFQLKFRVPKKSDWEEISRLPDKEATERLVDFVEDWDVQDEHGQRLPFSREVFLSALDDKYFDAAVGRAILQASSGARAKN